MFFRRRPEDDDDCVDDDDDDVEASLARSTLWLRSKSRRHDRQTR